MLMSKLRQAVSLTKSTPTTIQITPLTSDLSPNTTNAQIKNSTLTIPSQINTASLSLLQGQEILVITLTSKPTSTTGLIKTESTMNTKLTSEELKSICLALSTMQL